MVKILDLQYLFPKTIRIDQSLISIAVRTLVLFPFVDFWTSSVGKGGGGGRGRGELGSYSPGGGGLPYITEGDARRNFQKQPLKVTILGVAPANFIP